MYELTEGIINLKLQRYADNQFKMAFGEGTEEGWKKFKRNVNKKIDYLNKDIDKWNREHSKYDEQILKIEPVDKKWFWMHY